jgi:hypothetical protein
MGTGITDAFKGALDFFGVPGTQKILPLSGDTAPPKKPAAPPEDEGPKTALGTAQQRLQKETDNLKVLNLELQGQKLFADAVKSELDYREKIQAVDDQIAKAREDGHTKELAVLQATKDQLQQEQQITLEMKAQALATTNLEKMKSTLAELAAIPEGQAGLDAGYSEKMVYAGGQARQAQDLQDTADYYDKTQGNFVAGADFQNRAENLKGTIQPLKDSEKDMQGTIRAGIEASDVLKKIEENTGKPAVWSG